MLSIRLSTCLNRIDVPTVVWHILSRETPWICAKTLYLPDTRVSAEHFCHRQDTTILISFYADISQSRDGSIYIPAWKQRTIKVIYFWVSKKPVGKYMLPHNNYGTVSNYSEDMFANSTKKLPFSTTHWRLTSPLQRTLRISAKTLYHQKLESRLNICTADSVSSSKATNSQAQNTGVKTEINVNWPFKTHSRSRFGGQWKAGKDLHTFI